MRNVLYSGSLKNFQERSSNIFYSLWMSDVRMRLDLRVCFVSSEQRKSIKSRAAKNLVMAKRRKRERKRERIRDM